MRPAFSCWRKRAKQIIDNYANDATEDSSDSPNRMEDDIGYPFKEKKRVLHFCYREVYSWTAGDLLEVWQQLVCQIAERPQHTKLSLSGTPPISWANKWRIKPQIRSWYLCVIMLVLYRYSSAFPLYCQKRGLKWLPSPLLQVLTSPPIGRR